MELHWIFTYMLKKNQITIAEMITIIFMSEEMQNLLEARIRNGMDVDSLFNESKDMVVTLDMKSLKRKVKQFEKRDAKDVIQPLMDKKLPVEMNGCAKDAIIKEVGHVKGHLYYAFLMMRQGCYIFYQNASLRKGGKREATIVYMEGQKNSSMSMSELKRMFKKK